MKVVILAAGYANRLRSETQDGLIPKTLLPITINGKRASILSFIYDKIREIKDNVDGVIVVVNDKYEKSIKQETAKYFGEHKNEVNFGVRIISDESKDASEAKGANYAMRLAANAIPSSYKGEIMVMASDNYFDFSLNDLVAEYDRLSEKKPVNMVVSKVYPDEEREFIAKNFGILNIGKNNKIIGLDEKPGIENLKSNNVSLALYMFNNRDFKRINEYMDMMSDDPKKRDSLGYFINYLTKNTHTYTYPIDTFFCDIGTPEEYRKMRDEGHYTDSAIGILSRIVNNPKEFD